MSITNNLTKSVIEPQCSSMPLQASINRGNTIRLVLQDSSLTPDLKQSRISRRFVRINSPDSLYTCFVIMASFEKHWAMPQIRLGFLKGMRYL